MVTNMSKNNLTNYPENDWRDYLSHSYKGTTWGKHKYIAIKNGRYIYPKDSSGSTRGMPNENQVVKDDEYYRKAAVQSLSGVNYPLTNEIVNKRAEELKARDQQNEKKKKTAKNIGNKVKGALSLWMLRVLLQVSNVLADPVLRSRDLERRRLADMEPSRRETDLEQRSSLAVFQDVRQDKKSDKHQKLEEHR